MLIEGIFQSNSKPTWIYNLKQFNSDEKLSVPPMSFKMKQIK